MIWFMLIANFIASIIYLIKNRKEGVAAILIFLQFLVIPVLGILMYYMPILVFRILHKKNVYDIGDLIFAQDDEVYEERPNIEQEMNVIPVKEVLAINDATEKRQFILSIIKEDMGANYKMILPALQDSDSETSHYAAAMAMEIQSKGRKKILQLERQLQSEWKDEKQTIQEIKLVKELLDALEDYLNSGVLTEKDEILSKQKYISIMNNIEKSELFDQSYYLNVIEYMIEMGKYSEAIMIIEKQMKQEVTQNLYEKLLKIYYLTGNEEKLIQTITEIRNSSITLSAEGLQQLRFWMKQEGMT